MQAKKFKAYTDDLLRNAKIEKKADATPPAPKAS